MRVADLIATRREVYFITEDTTVHDAARYLREKQVRAAVYATGRASCLESFRKATFPIKSPPKISVPPGCAFPKS